MLRQIHIQNFRCLKNVSAEFKPLTVLVGPNDSGKSVLLDAIKSLADLKREFSITDHWRNEPSLPILIRGWTDKGEFETRSTSKREKLVFSDAELDSNESIVPASRFHLPSTGIPMNCEGYSEAEEQELRIETDGSRIPALLDYLLRKDRNRFFQIVEILRSQIPGLSDLDIATPRPQQRRLDLVIENGMRLQADLASVGVRMLLFFVAIAHHPKPPKMILLEEPETGVHPKRLAGVMKLLHDLAAGAHGVSPVQVVLTTHSPYLLDCVTLPMDQVLVFRRTNEGERSVTAVDVDRMKNFLDEFMLGEVWFNEEEAGLVAKK